MGITIVQSIIGILLVISILLQNRGSGLGMAFGGEGNVYLTKRGVEKKLFQFTIFLSIAFLGISLFHTLF